MLGLGVGEREEGALEISATYLSSLVPRHRRPEEGEGV